MAAEALPNVEYRAMRFVLADEAAATASGGRMLNMIRVNDPLWTLACETIPLHEPDVQKVLAWKERRRGGLRSVLGVQNTICRPMAHAAETNALPARTTGTVTTVNGNAITFGGVNAGLILAADDMFGLKFGEYRALCRIQTVSSPTANSRSVTVEPIPPDYAAKVGATVIFENPSLVMRIVPNSFTSPSGNLPVMGWQLVESAL